MTNAAQRPEAQQFLVVVPTDINERPEITSQPGFTPYVPAAGYVPAPCAVCGCDGWLGPKQQAAKAKNDSLTILCALCVPMVTMGHEPDVRMIDDIENL